MHWFFILPKTLILGPVWVSFGLKTSNKSLPKKVLKNYQNSMWQFFIQLEKPHFGSIFGHFGPKIPEQLKKKKNLAPSFFTLGGIIIHAENLKVLEVVLEKNSGQTDTYRIFHRTFTLEIQTPYWLFIFFYIKPNYQQRGVKIVISQYKTKYILWNDIFLYSVILGWRLAILSWKY